jgi:hypothetical protein
MTKKMKLTAYGTIGFLVVAFALASVPSATAQTLEPNTQEKTAKTDLLMPEAGQLTRQLETILQIPSGASGCIATIKVEWKIKSAPAYASVAINPPTTTFVYSQETTGVPGTSPASGEQKLIPTKPNIIISATRDAPAFKTDDYVFQTVATPGSSETGGCNFKQGSSDLTVPIKNDFLTIMSVQPQAFLLKSGQNSKIQFPVKLDNRANGPTKTRVTVEQTSNNKLDTVIPPGLVYLDSSLKGGAAKTTETVIITGQTPHSNGYTNSFFTFEATFLSEYDGTLPGESNAKPDEQTLVLSVQVQGVYVPGFDPAIAIGALGVALLGVRRFRA